jgi:hypothetical protein
MALLNMNLTNIDSSENDTKHCNCFSFGNLFKIVFYHKTT